MSQTILIEPDKEGRKRLNINLHRYTGTDVIERKNAKETIDLLQILPEVDLIVTASSIAQEKTAMDIVNYLDRANLIVPVIVVGDFDYQDSMVDILKEEEGWRCVIRKAALHLGVDSKEMARRVRIEFFPIPLFYFTFLDKTCCPIFVRNQSELRGIEYVKKLNAFDFVEQTFEKKWREMGLNYVYVNSEELPSFVNFVCSRLSEMFEDDEMSLSRRVSLAENAYQIVGHHVRNIDLREASVQLGQAVVDALVFSVNQLPQVNLLLNTFVELKTRYAVRLMHLSSFISYEIIRRMEWGTQEHHERLTFALLFNDSLLQDDREALVETKEDLEKEQFSPQRKKVITHHPELIAKMIEKNGSLPEGTSEIVKGHHGSLQGLGLNEEVKESFSPLANAALISLRVSSFILKKRPSRDQTLTFVKELEKTFPEKGFSEMFKALLSGLENVL